MITLLDQLSIFIERCNKEILNGNRFLDWPISEKPEAIHTWLQAAKVMTFEADSGILAIFGREDLRLKYGKVAKKFKKHCPKENTTQQAASLLVLSNLQDPEKQIRKSCHKMAYRACPLFMGTTFWKRITDT